MSVRCLLTTVTCLLAATLLLAILICSLMPSPNMREVWWILDWVGEWADRNGNFRNFPVFAVFAALLFFVFRSLRLPTASLVCETGRRGDQLIPRILTTALRAALCVSALGVALEVAQLLFLPNRHFDWADIGWSTSGAFVGAGIAASCLQLLKAAH